MLKLINSLEQDVLPSAMTEARKLNGQENFQLSLEGRGEFRDGIGAGQVDGLPRLGTFDLVEKFFGRTD